MGAVLCCRVVASDVIGDNVHTDALVAVCFQGALSLNVLFIGWAVEWGLLMHVFFQWAFVTGFKQIPFTAKLATLSFYSAAAVLVSHAVLLGRIDARQGIVLATFECE